MSRLGLRGRLTLASVAVLALALVVVSAVGLLVLQARLRADSLAVLRDRADAQLAALDTGRGRIRGAAELRDGALGQATWVYARGRALLRGVADPAVQQEADALAGVRHTTDREVEDSVRLLGVPAYADDGRPIGTVVVALSIRPYERTRDLAFVGALLFDLVVLAVTGLVAWRVVGAALRPVAVMTEQAAAWSASDLHRRFDLGPPRDELTALAATLDGLLGRLDAAMAHEQRLSAEMAHELRTPLAGLRMEAELALRSGHGDDERRDALERVVAGTDRMAGVIDTLLATARTGQSPTPARCDAAAAVREATDAVRSAARAHDVALDVAADAGPAPVSVGPEVVAQALHPVLENAVRHAATRVEVHLERRGAAVVVGVADDGPGLDGLDADAVFEPGASTTGGAGLGLPLARRLARSGGGDVVAVPARSGACFELRLPAAHA